MWKLNENMACADYSIFGFNGMPVILCPDEETALAIKGSLEKTEDGLYFPHKFQVRMHEWIKNHSDDDLKMKHIDLKPFLPLMKEEPQSACLLGSWGLFSYINSMIAQQSIDKDSPDFRLLYRCSSRADGWCSSRRGCRPPYWGRRCQTRSSHLPHEAATSASD